MNDEPCAICKDAGFYCLDLPIHHPDFGKLLTYRCRGVAVTARLVKSGDIDPDKTFASFRATHAPQAYNQCEAYASAPSGLLFLHGEPGCGKTHLAHAIANHVAAAGAEPLFRVVPDLLFDLRSSFQSRGEDSYDTKFNRLRSVDMLILDDFGAERATDWAGEQLFQIVNARYSKYLPTVITSNLPPNHAHYDKRLQSRFADTQASRIVHIVAAYYRRLSLRDRMAA